MNEPEMHAYTVDHCLAFVRVARPLDDLPPWMARCVIAAETDDSGTVLLAQTGDEDRWNDPDLGVEFVSHATEPFKFGPGFREVQVFYDPKSGDEDWPRFVIVGKPGSFGPRFGGTL